MRRITASLIIFLLVIQCGFVTIDAQHHAAHVHGNAQLKMVATSDALQIQVTIPAESTIGFEYAPKNQAEMEKVEEVFSFFRDIKHIEVTIVSDENIAYSTLTPHESQLKLPQRI